MLPDIRIHSLPYPDGGSQCTYRCVVLPDHIIESADAVSYGLNAPTGAWCSLTGPTEPRPELSQCTYRCVVLPDQVRQTLGNCLPESQCTYRCVVLPDTTFWVTFGQYVASQCTYRCVVLPDAEDLHLPVLRLHVSMHLQVRGAP